jgi:hypothetical protein
VLNDFCRASGRCLPHSKNGHKQDRIEQRLSLKALTNFIKVYIIEQCLILKRLRPKLAA